MSVRTPAGWCPWCRAYVEADVLPAAGRTEDGGARVEAIHRWGGRMDDVTGGGGMGCYGRVRIYIAPDGSAPDGWERNRSAG